MEATAGPVADRVERSVEAARRESSLGAFWLLCEERAAKRARSLDDRRAAGHDLGPLAGATVAVKDCFDMAGAPTTAGVPGSSRPAEHDAAAVAALEHAGAVSIGKTAMDPLAWSTHGQAAGHPPCLNPRDVSLSPGGSSAGSAASVAAGITALGLGTDLAGSVRVPASYCGIVGLKPALRAVSLRGCVPVAPSFHVPGVMAASVGECRTVYEALSRRRLPPVQAAARVVIAEDLFEDADPRVAGPCMGALRELCAAGSGVAARELAWLRLEWRAQGFGRILAFELARDWGRRIEREPQRFPDHVRESVAVGRTIEPDVYRDAVLAIRRARARLGRRLGAGAVLASPTVPVPVPPREEQITAVSIRYTRVFSALGWPALSVPCGTDSDGRPVGLQLAAPGAALGTLLELAEALERVRSRRAA